MYRENITLYIGVMIEIIRYDYPVIIKNLFTVWLRRKWMSNVFYGSTIGIRYRSRFYIIA